MIAYFQLAVLFLALVSCSSVPEPSSAESNHTDQNAEAASASSQDRPRKNLPLTKKQLQLLEHPEQIIDLLDDGAITEDEIPNPHWQKNGCIACHTTAKVSKPIQLREKDPNRLCTNCHEQELVEAFIHPVGMTPPDDFLQRMPDNFKNSLQDGKVSCITCHDLPIQCLEKRFPERKINPLFFRGGPYLTRTKLCYNCHDPKMYERYNPHDQITDEGELRTKQCFYCHNTYPDRRKVRSIDDVSFNLAEDLKKLCTGCHPWRPHPGGIWAGTKIGEGPDHLVIPPKKIKQRMERAAKQQGIILPLEPETGRIFCATCHNPHERGIQYRPEADKGADGYKRLRRGAVEICRNCHNM